MHACSCSIPAVPLPVPVPVPVPVALVNAGTPSRPGRGRRRPKERVSERKEHQLQRVTARQRSRDCSFGDVGGKDWVGVHRA